METLLSKNRIKEEGQNHHYGASHMHETTAVMRFSLKGECDEEDDDGDLDVNSSISSSDEAQNKSSCLNDDVNESKLNQS